MSRISATDYIIAFGNFYKIDELYKNRIQKRNRLKAKFIHTQFGIGQMPRSEECDRLINEKFKEFCRFICDHYNKPLFHPCTKRKLTEYASKKALASALISTEAKRKEVRRYLCKKCNAWHLTSKHNFKTLTRGSGE